MTFYKNNGGDYKMEKNLFSEETIYRWFRTSRIIYFKKGDIIIKDSDFSNYMYLMADGMAHISYLHEAGKECTIDVVEIGQFLNIYNLFIDDNNTMIGKALTDVEIALVNREEVLAVLEADRDLAMEMLKKFSVKIHDLTEILSQVAYGKVEDRILYVFNKMSGDYDGPWKPIGIGITHQDLGSMVGATRETVTSILNKLIREDRIKIVDYKIWIRKYNM